MAGALGRVRSKTTEHLDKYPLRFANIPDKPVPITAGFNWYTNFDKPQKDNRGMWWIGKGDLGRIRGGHCVCIPHNDSDLYSWYDYYNQGSEGACVGFGASRMMSLLNRELYNPWWLWDRSKENDEWADTNPGDSEGTSVNAAMWVLRNLGHLPRRLFTPILAKGVSAYRWLNTAEMMLEVLGNEKYRKLGAVPLHNSWGRDYPHKVWMPLETWQRLMNEFGEFAIISTR